MRKISKTSKFLALTLVMTMLVGLFAMIPAAAYDNSSSPLTTISDKRANISFVYLG